MEAEQKLLPKWIFIISGFFALMEIVAGIAICLSPQGVLEKVDVSAQGVIYLVYMWAVRQFAIGVIFAYSTFKKSVAMLTLSYIFFLVMFIGDVIVGILQKEISFIITALVMCIISSVMLFAVNKKR